MSRTSEGHAARGSDVEDEVDPWVVLVLEEIGDAQKCAHTQAVLESTGNSACGLSLETKNPLGAFMKGFGDAD